MNWKQNIQMKLWDKSGTWQKEHTLLGGRKNPDKVFYVIRRSGMKLGLFSYFNTNLGRISYAYENDMIPVIDMQNFKNSFQAPDEKENIWEWFFEQPSDYTLKEVYESKHIIISEVEHSSVVAPCNYLTSKGFDVTLLEIE